MLYAFELSTPIMLLCCRSNSENPLTSKATEAEIEDKLKPVVAWCARPKWGDDQLVPKKLQKRRESHLLILLATVFFDHAHLAEAEIGGSR